MEIPTAEEISILPIKEVSCQQFLKIAKRFLPPEEMCTLSVRLVNELEHGDYLGVHKTNSGKMYRLHLKKLWIKEFSLSYSVHKNTKKGKELLISNMPLPPGPVVKKTK